MKKIMREGGDTSEATDSRTAATNELLAAAKTVIDGFAQGIFTRDISHDGDPGWAMRLLPYLQAIGKMNDAIAKAEGR